MRVYLLPVIALCALLLAACKNEKPLVKEYSTHVAYYPKGHENYRHAEVAGVRRIIDDSTFLFMITLSFQKITIHWL